MEANNEGAGLLNGLSKRLLYLTCEGKGREGEKASVGRVNEFFRKDNGFSEHSLSEIRKFVMMFVCQV